MMVALADVNINITINVTLDSIKRRELSKINSVKMRDERGNTQDMPEATRE